MLAILARDLPTTGPELQLERYSSVAVHFESKDGALFMAPCLIQENHLL